MDSLAGIVGKLSKSFEEQYIDKGTIKPEYVENGKIKTDYQWDPRGTEASHSHFDDKDPDEAITITDSSLCPKFKNIYLVTPQDMARNNIFSASRSNKNEIVVKREVWTWGESEDWQVEYEGRSLSMFDFDVWLACIELHKARQFGTRIDTTLCDLAKQMGKARSLNTYNSISESLTRLRRACFTINSSRYVTVKNFFTEMAIDLKTKQVVFEMDRHMPSLFSHLTVVNKEIYRSLKRPLSKKIYVFMSSHKAKGAYLYMSEDDLHELSGGHYKNMFQFRPEYKKALNECTEKGAITSWERLKGKALKIVNVSSKKQIPNI